LEYRISGDTTSAYGSLAPLDLAALLAVLLTTALRGATLLAGVLFLAGCQEHASSGPQSSGGQGRDEHAEFLADFAAQQGLDDLPEVQVVRTVTPEESKAVVDECVADQGWAQLPDGTFQFPSEQDRAFAMAMYICYASYPVDAAYTGPLDQQQWAAIYDYWIDETLPCLADQGFSLPEPPSRETFLSSPTWSPDTPEVRDQVAVRVAAGELISHEYVFTDVCPVYPPAEIRKGQGG
jgi:hypothetical protein